jgi:hypothetical protein
MVKFITIHSAWIFLVFVLFSCGGGDGGSDSETPQADTSVPVYVVIMNHIEGDMACSEGDNLCLTATLYQTLPLPPPGITANPSYSLDIAGNDLIYEMLLTYTDSYGEKPKLFIEPAGEWWQTYLDPVFGGKAFDTYDYLSLGNEFGIQGHGILYSGNAFGWYHSPRTEQGIYQKIQDLHYFAEQAYCNERKINNGKTYTGGWKLEKDALGDIYAEYVIDHAAYSHGYCISFEDHDGHIEDEPSGINNARPAYYVYRAIYDDGVEIIKIDMNGSVTGQCEGETPRCETPEEAIARFEETLQARSLDDNKDRVYFFAFVVHSNGVWNDYNLEAGGLPLAGEGLGLKSIMDAIQFHVNNGADVKFVTPIELAAIFEEKNPSSGVENPQPEIESPFGFHPASVFKQGYSDNGYADALNIGIQWTREGLYAFWFMVQRDLSKQEYDFTQHDEQWGRIPDDINILANIAPQGNIDEGYALPGSYLAVDTDQYISFVYATVERYDGDGIADMPGLTNPIKYWQVGNEPSVLKLKDFAALQTITYRAIKDACPDCSVLIGGATGMPPASEYISDFNIQYKPILEALNGNYVDIMDFHWYGNATGDYRGAQDVYDYIRSELNALGFPSIPIWITEMGSYSGDPDSPYWLPQTERQQAADYLKRFVYSLSLGVKRIFPAFGLIEGFKYDNGYFDHTGLIYDGWGAHDQGLGVKKLSYYSYKKMTDMLDGSDWDTILTIQESEDVYIFQFTKDGRPLYVVWWDYFNDPMYSEGTTREAVITGIQGNGALVTEAVPLFLSGKEVTDYTTAFRTYTLSISDGTLAFTLGAIPLFVEIQS